MIETIKPGQKYKLTQYEKLGGEAGVRQLVKFFYEAMDNTKDVKTIRDMHAPDVTEAVDKLFLFLSGWLGGPS
jgi:hemoglobin